MLTLSEYLTYCRRGASSSGGGGTLDFTYPSAAAGPPPVPFPDPVNYRTTLPFTPPPGPDRRFVRMDAWGVTVPGLPFVKGVSSEFPERLMTYVIQRYTPEWRQRCYDEHKARKLTHWFLSLADMVIEDGMSVDDVLALAIEIRAQGFWISMWLGSKNYPQFIPRDADAATWRATIEPYLVPMMQADCLHHAIIGGEFDMWNQGDPHNDMPMQIAQMVVQLCRPYGVEAYFHFQTHYTFWGNVPGAWNGQTINDRIDWTRVMCDIGVRGIYYQGDPGWKLNEYQGRIADSLGRVDPRWDFIAHEIMAIYQFCGYPVGSPWPNEADGRMMGFGCLCTGPSAPHTDVPMWGYGNGAVYPPDHPLAGFAV